MSTDQENVKRPPTNVDKLRGLPWGVAWSVTNAVFAQYTFFGSIFVLYLNTLGLDKVQIGGLLSLLPFMGIVAVFTASAIARVGYKRTFIIFMSSRTATAALLPLAPWILIQHGPRALLIFMLATISAFGLFRAIGFTAFYPWLQEQVPDSIRGKYTAVKNALSSLTAFVAMLAAGYVLGPAPALSQFGILIVVGCVAGAVSMWTAAYIPGGAPQRGETAERTSFQEMVAAGRDPSFVRYLLGAGLVTLATGPLVSFVPLFMKEQVGLSANQVVWLETGALLGGLASSYLWGWLADRYGSKPVMLSGVWLLAALPVAWLLMPRHLSWSLYVALAIALWQGFVNTGWVIGSGRLLFVSVVPAEKKTAYLALYYAWMGVVGGVGQLLGGWLVDLTASVSGKWWIVQFDPYTILFLVGITFPLLGRLVFARVRADSPVTMGQFAGMFLRGNPFLAMESLMRYHRARDERATVAMTERLGAARSPLTVDELLEALHDPRFYVRFEAIVSIARHGPDPRLTEALIQILAGDEPALSTIAAWGLGRIGDEAALEALRQALNSRYRSVQAHCARSLGSLGDKTVIPLLLDRLAREDDIGLRLAFAAALGQLGASEATGRLLELLRHSSTAEGRSEFGLALARLSGEEHRFIQSLRRVESEPGTALSQSVTALKGKLFRSHERGTEMESLLDAAAGALAHDELERGLDLLCSALQFLSTDGVEGTCLTVVQECVVRLQEWRAQRLEYAVLLLHALDCLPVD